MSNEENKQSEIIRLSSPERINGTKEVKERLNLTKYAFLDYLKGDVFAWLNCNQNFQKASEEDSQLRLSTPWRYKDDEQGEDFDIDAYYAKLRFDIRDGSIDWNEEAPDQIKAGLRVGEYSEIWAKQNWPKHKVKYIKGYGIDLENVDKTKEYLEKYDNLVLFEAEFTYNEFKIRTDILVKTGKKFEVIEVKGSGSPKLLYAFDLMFQRAIIEKGNPEYAGWDYSLLLLDRTYQHNSDWSKEKVAELVFARTWNVSNCDNLGSKIIPELDPINPTKWNRISDPYFMNELIDWISFEDTPVWGEKKGRARNFTFPFEDFYNTYAVKEILENFDNILLTIKEIQSLKNPPKLEFEDRNNRYMSSDYMQWALTISGAYDGTENNSIFDFKGTKFNWKTKCKLFKSRIKKMSDVDIKEMVPNNLVSAVSGKSDEMAILDFLQLEGTKNASGYSAIIQRAYLNKDDFLLHRERLFEDLKRYEDGPIYMYDFETANLAIPEVHMAKPYEQVVYQYSIHVILDPLDYDFKTMKNVVHYEWLAEDRNTFHLDAWNNFAKVFEKHGKGVYAAWNMSFEKTCIKNALNNWDFDSNVEEWMREVKENTIDLMHSFKYKFYYHKELKGSYSIKFAGPHFAKEIDYKDLPLVKKGDQSAAVAKMWLREESIESDGDQSAVNFKKWLREKGIESDRDWTVADFKKWLREKGIESDMDWTVADFKKWLREKGIESDMDWSAADFKKWLREKGIESDRDWTAAFVKKWLRERSIESDMDWSAEVVKKWLSEKGIKSDKNWSAEVVKKWLSERSIKSDRDWSTAFAKMWLRERSIKSDRDWAARREGMLKYCEYDTLLMVAILQRLQERVKPSYQRKQIMKLEETND